MNKKQLREKYINDFFDWKFSEAVDYMENYCNSKFDLFELDLLPDALQREGMFSIYFYGHYFDESYNNEDTKNAFVDDYEYFSFNEKELQENGFRDVIDFFWQLTYTINKKYTTKETE